jgi:hypothetical protein
MRPSLLTDAGLKKQENVIEAGVLSLRAANESNEIKGTGSEFLMQDAKPFSMGEFVSETQDMNSNVPITFDTFLAKHKK